MSRDDQRTQWFRDSRFGMFIHWGLYAIPARGEWVKNQEQLTDEQYQPYFDAFNPSRYDPREWARLAKHAGMKYAVLTAKHHDGFCLFDSALTDYKATNTPCGRDLVREYLDAFRAEGIRVGLYYSLLDWRHPDYPHYGDSRHPARNDPSQSNEHRDWNRYLAYMHGQIRELLTNYGKLDLMWFDFSYDDLEGEAWGASHIMEMIHQYQPDMLIDNRLEGSGSSRGSIVTANPKPYAGDFTSPEQMVPPDGCLNDLGEPIPWESCMTLNDHWGYFAGDTHYKSARLVVRSLVECVSKNGNLIVNVGPDANGEIPAQARQILTEVGDWMRGNGESIYGCGKAEYPKPEWGRYTQRGNTLYAHVMEEAVSAICLQNMGKRAQTLCRLADHSEVKLTRFWTLTGYDQHAFFFPYPGQASSYPLPDETDTVISVKLAKED
ncbi:MAG: alpha-L-fucosidase [Eubacteriales bacterium]|nr:alpha-L-fucosidase [Eubacteriales bacterium]